MSGENYDLPEGFTEKELEAQYMKSLDSIEEGQMISGKVIQISEENVFVDVGYKSEGRIPIAEFPETPAIGDEVNVVLVRKEGREGSIIVSKEKSLVKNQTTRKRRFLAAPWLQCSSEHILSQ